MFNVKTGGYDTLYIELQECENVEKTISVPDSGLNLDFNREGELVGIESINRYEDFPTEWLEEAGLK